MTDTLTQLVTKLQALLLGDSTTFTTATCTAAIRQALVDVNFKVPGHAAELVTAAAGAYEYELSDQTAMQIVDVLRQGSDTYNDFSKSLAFDGYFEDDRPFFRLRRPEANNQILIPRYTKPYTINGLDAAAVSTLPALYDVVLLNGAAWKACTIRATGRNEPINLNSDVPATYAKLATFFEQAFQDGLTNLAFRHFPTSEPLGHGWNDEWTGQF